MKGTHGFYDLNISESCLQQNNLQKTLQTLYNHGYRTIAINQVFEDGNLEPKKKQKKGESRDAGDILPLPYPLESVHKNVKEWGFENFKVLNRLTIVFSNQEILHKVTKSPNYKKYHIVAALPTTAPAFMFTCNTFDADILTINPENKINMKINRKCYNQLMERGYHFELMYGPAIQDSTKRKNIIHAAHLYHSFGKSRNNIISSGATNYMHIRSPYDVINLGIIFGLSEQQCKSAILNCPRKVIVNSVGRQHGKAVMFVENVENEEENSNEDVIMLDESEDEDIIIDQPAQKKSKQ